MVQGTGQLIDLGFPQYCSLTILCRLSDRATFISLRMDGYNTKTNNISQKASTFGRLDLVGVTSGSNSGQFKPILAAGPVFLILAG